MQMLSDYLTVVCHQQETNMVVFPCCEFYKDFRLIYFYHALNSISARQ